MSYIHEKLRKSFERTLKTKTAKKNEKYPNDFWKWAVKNKNCKIEYYISSLDDSGREDQNYFKTRKEMTAAWKEMKPVNYDMHSYKCLTLVTGEGDNEQEDLVDDEIINSFYNAEEDNDA
jgi:hypothetical protein